MRQILGLMGTRGAGKDTAAEVLVAAGWRRFAFADLLYQEVATAFGVAVPSLQQRETKETPLTHLALTWCSDPGYVARVLHLEWEKGSDMAEATSRPRSPRETLQLWGTEYRRNEFGLLYWIGPAKAVLLADRDVNFVITDVRYPNEAELITSMHGTLARVIRPGQQNADDVALQHISEQAMLEYPATYTWKNVEGHPEKLTAVVREVFL